MRQINRLNLKREREKCLRHSNLSVCIISYLLEIAVYKHYHPFCPSAMSIIPGKGNKRTHKFSSKATMPFLWLA